MRRFRPAVLLGIALWTVLGGSGQPVRAEESPGEPREQLPALQGPGEPQQGAAIFQRFGQGRYTPETWLVMPEVPVYVRPQLEHDAKIVNNTGANLVVGFRPRNRIFFSRGYDFAQTIWEPKRGSVERVEVTTFDMSELLNVQLGRVAVLTLGIGLGLMDGVIEERKGSQINRLEPFVPFQFGLGAPLGESVFLGLKLSHHFFLGPGPVVHLTRGLVGLGFYF